MPVSAFIQPTFFLMVGVPFLRAGGPLKDFPRQAVALLRGQEGPVPSSARMLQKLPLHFPPPLRANRNWVLPFDNYKGTRRTKVSNFLSGMDSLPKRVSFLCRGSVLLPHQKKSSICRNRGSLTAEGGAMRKGLWYPGVPLFFPPRAKLFFPFLVVGGGTPLIPGGSFCPASCCFSSDDPLPPWFQEQRSSPQP